MRAAQDFFRTWTLPNYQALSFLDTVYPDQILYFGKKASKGYVLHEKEVFAQRWPDRVYSVRPGSVSTSCDPASNTCTVSGMVDWRVSSRERNANSSGSAKFQLTFMIAGNSPALVSEWSEVVSRN
jgi:hypothetical protein